MATTLNGANQQTEWFDLRGAAESVCFTLTGNFSTAVGLRYSNLDAYAKGTDYTTDDTTWSAADGPLEIPFGIAKFCAFFSSGSWTTNTTCTVRFSRTKNPDGQLVDIAPQERN